MGVPFSTLSPALTSTAMILPGHRRGETGAVRLGIQLVCERIVQLENPVIAGKEHVEAGARAYHGA